MADEVKLVLRMPATLHERIKRLAEAEHRSLNGEILHILERHATQHERRASPEIQEFLAALAEADLAQGVVTWRMGDGTVEVERPPKPSPEAVVMREAGSCGEP